MEGEQFKSCEKVSPPGMLLGPQRAETVISATAADQGLDFTENVT